MKKVGLIFILSFLVSCDTANNYFDSMNDFSKQVNKVLSEKCNVKVYVNFNSGMFLNGEIKIHNANINFFSKNPPSCTIKEVEDEFYRFLKNNNINQDVKLDTTPWEKPPTVH